MSWQENLAQDEMPPEWMWPLDEELVEWFEDVETKRREKYGDSGGSNDDDDDFSPMMSNELAKEMK